MPGFRSPHLSSRIGGGLMTSLRMMVSALALIGSLTLGAAEAQQGSAVLVGTVDNAADGVPIADGLVTVTSVARQGEEYAVTDASGRYRIAGLAPGEYTLRIEVPGFKPYAREAIALRADAVIRLNVAVLPDALQGEEVVVVGRAPTVDVGSSGVGVTINSELTRRVPLSAPGGRGGAVRSIESVVEVAPMAEGDTFGVAIGGASSPENSYLLDGISINNSAYGLLGTPLSIEFIEEISVLTGGYMPEYGHAMGGIVNAITKSGTNDFHGSAWFNIAPGSLSGTPKRVLREGQTIETSRKLSLMTDLGADVSGPIVKDRLWFYAGAQWARTAYDLSRSLHTSSTGSDGETIRTLIPESEQTFKAKQHMMQGFGKLTWDADKKNQFELSLNAVYPISGGGSNFGINPLTDLPEIGTASNGYEQPLNGEYGALAHEFLGDSINAVLKWSNEMSEDTRFDTWIGFHRERGGRLPADGSSIGSSSGLAGQTNVWYQLPHSLAEFETVPGGACDADLADGADPSMFVCPVNDYRTGGSEFINKAAMTRVEGRTIWTQLVEAAGHHVFKAGLNAEGQFYKHTKGYAGGRSVVEYDQDLWLDGAVYGYLTAPGEPVVLSKLQNSSESMALGGFIQDSWEPLDGLTVNLGLRYDAQWLFANNQLAMALTNQLSPRAGVVYDPTKEGRAKVFANYGRYYEKVPLLMLDRYLTGEPLLFALRACDEPGVSGGNCFDDAASIPIGDPPNNNYVVAGAGTVPVDPDIEAPSGDEVVLGGEYEIIEDGRLGLVYTKRWLNQTIEDMSRDEANTFFFGNPGQGIAGDFPDAKRNYDAITLQFTKVFSKRWLANASYTASWLRGNYGGLFRADDSQLDPHQNSDFDLQSLVTNREGYLPGDRRHSLKAFGAYMVDFGQYGAVTPGLALRARSGAPSNLLGSHPLYGVDQVYILPRDSGKRLPWTYGVDVRLDYTVSFGEDRSLSLTMDVFNLFNIQHAVQRDNRYTVASVNPVEDGDVGDLEYEDGSAFDEADKNANFGRVVAYQKPRMFRFGVKGTF